MGCTTHSLRPLQDPDESITPLTHQEDPDTPRGLGLVMVQPQLSDPVPESVNSTANSPYADELVIPESTDITLGMDGTIPVPSTKMIRQPPKKYVPEDGHWIT